MRLPRSVAVIASAVAVLASCSSGSSEANVPATTAAPPIVTTIVTTTATASPTTTAPPTTTTLSPEAAVLAAYHEYRAAQRSLLMEPDLSSPTFDSLMTGRQRDRIRQRAQEYLDGRYRLRLPADSIARLNATVEKVAGTDAVLVVCSVDDTYLEHLDTGEEERFPLQTYLLRVDLLIDDGRWKVENSTIDRTWDGVAGCAA